MITLHRADMQFQGQSHILPVAIAHTGITLPELRALFEAAYWQRFGVELPEIRPVLVNLHTAVIGKRKGVSLEAITRAQPRATLGEAIRGRPPGVVRTRRLAGHAALRARALAATRARLMGRRSSNNSIARL